MNKKVYEAPSAHKVLIETEGVMASSQLKIDGNVSGNSQLSNEMEENWSNEIWGDNEL